MDVVHECCLDIWYSMKRLFEDNVILYVGSRMGMDKLKENGDSSIGE